MRIAPFGDPLIVIAIGDRAAHHEQQHFRQWMRHPPLLPRILHDRQMIQQCSKARLLRRNDRGDAHGVAPNQRHTTESDFPQAENRR
jgi:hypothetical protein